MAFVRGDRSDDNWTAREYAGAMHMAQAIECIILDHEAKVEQSKAMAKANRKQRRRER